MNKHQQALNTTQC